MLYTLLLQVQARRRYMNIKRKNTGGGDKQHCHQRIAVVLDQ